MSTTALTIAVSVMMLWLNHTRHVVPPPEWLRFIVYQIFARIICYGKLGGKMRFKKRSEEDEELLARQMKREKGEAGGTPPPTGLAATTLAGIAQFASATAALERDLQATPTSTPAQGKRLESLDSSDGKINDATAEIKAKLEEIEKESKDAMTYLFEAVRTEVKAKSIDRIKEEWTEITKIINAFAFYVLLAFTIVFIIMCAILWVIVDSK